MSQHSSTAEGLKQAAHTGGGLASSLSHDLRTPLNIIIGFSELMLDEVPGPINDNQRQCLNDILSSSRCLLELLNRTLDLPNTGSSDGRDAAKQP